MEILMHGQYIMKHEQELIKHICTEMDIPIMLHRTNNNMVKFITEYNVIWFENEEDAMAFKLRWI